MFGVGPSTSFVGMSKLFRAKRKKPSRPFHAILKNIVGNRRDRSMLYPFKKGLQFGTVCDRSEPFLEPVNHRQCRNRRDRSTLYSRLQLGTVATAPAKFDFCIMLPCVDIHIVYSYANILYIHIYIIYMYDLYIRISTCIHTHTYIYIHMSHMDIHVNSNVYVYILTYTYMHT